MLRRIALLLPFAAVACRSPTQITFEITTDVPCAELGETFVTAGSIDVFGETIPPTTTAPRCTTEGHVGSLVVVPSGDDGAQIGVEAVVAVNASTDTCGANPQNCIVSKRALRFIPHEPLTVLMELDSACTGVVCVGEETCVEGTCKSAVITDPSQCSGSGCNDTTLGAVDGGPVDAGADATLPPADGGTDATLPPADAGDDSAPPPLDAGTDAPPDASPFAACSGTTSGAVIVPVATTNVQSASGLGQQRHLVVESGCHYYYFYPSDDGSQILTRTSDDFAAWSDGDPITLTVPEAGLTLGDDFAVAYAEIGGAHVLHVLAEETNPSATGDAIHLRTTIAGGHFAAPTKYSLPGSGEDSACTTDGPSVIITADGHVLDGMGWITHSTTFTHCDMNVLESSGVDDGTAFPGGFSLVGYSYSVPDYTYAHELVELPSTGEILAAFPDEDGTGDPQTEYALAVVTSPFDASFNAPAPLTDELFFDPDGGPQAWFGDWGLCRLTDANVYAVRHVFDVSGQTANDAFQALTFDGASWKPGAVPQPSAGALNQGLAIVSGVDPAKGMILATIDANATAVDLQLWTPASNAWTPLPSIVRTSPVQSLAGSGCGSPRASVFWTEGTGPYQIVTADLSGYLH